MNSSLPSLFRPEAGRGDRPQRAKQHIACVQRIMAKPSRPKEAANLHTCAQAYAAEAGEATYKIAKAHPKQHLPEKGSRARICGFAHSDTQEADLPSYTLLHKRLDQREEPSGLKYGKYCAALDPMKYNQAVQVVRGKGRYDKASQEPSKLPSKGG